MFNTTQTLRTFVSVAITAVLLSATVLGQDKTVGSVASGGVRRITLPEAQQQAMAAKVANLAKLSVDAAKYQRQIAQADFFPKVGSTFANLHFNKFLGETIRLARQVAEVPLMDKDQTIVAFTVAQPLTPLFKVHEAVNIAKADERIAQAKAEKMTAEISTDVERLYFALLIAQRQQSGAEAKSKMIESQLQLASTGTPPLAGMAERHAALLEVSKALVTANSKVTELTGSLNALIGFPPDTELELVAPEPVVETISLQQATQRAMATSPEVVEAEQTVVKARAATRLSKLDYIPDVAILGGYAYQTAVPLLPADFSFVGVLVSFNVFDFGKRERTASLRHTQLAMAEGNLELVKAKVAASVQKSFLELQRTRQILDLTQQLASMVQQVPASYQSAKLEAQSAWAKAEADMFQAQLDYRLAHTQLKGIMGGR